MPGRWIEINANLRKCRKIAKILKQKNPKLVMDLNANKFIGKAVNCCPYHRLGKDSIAHQHWDFYLVTHIAHQHWDFCPSNPSGICIKQDFLFFPWLYSTYSDYVSRNPYHQLEGNWAIIDLICHEIAHFTGSSTHSIHGKKWLDIYQKFLRQMALEVISGNYYFWYTNHYKVIN